MAKRHSLYLRDEEQMLLQALQTSEQFSGYNFSQLVSLAIARLAESEGYKIEPAKVVKIAT